MKTKQELNRQLDESFKNIALNKDKVNSRTADKLDQDRISMQSQMSQISFQDELTATLKSRKGETRNALNTGTIVSLEPLYRFTQMSECLYVTNSTVVITDHNFINKTKSTEGTDKDKDSADKNKELTLALLIEHLHRKNFHPRLISKLTEHSKTSADPVHHFLSASKHHLRVSEMLITFNAHSIESIDCLVIPID